MKKNFFITAAIFGLFFTSCEKDEDIKKEEQSTATSTYVVDIYSKTVTNDYEDKVDNCFNGGTYVVRVTVTGPEGYSSYKDYSVDNSTSFFGFEGSFTGFKNYGTYNYKVSVGSKNIKSGSFYVSTTNFKNGGSEDETFSLLSSDPAPC